MRRARRLVGRDWSVLGRIRTCAACSCGEKTRAGSRARVSSQKRAGHRTASACVSFRVFDAGAQRAAVRIRGRETALTRRELQKLSEHRRANGQHLALAGLHARFVVGRRAAREMREGGNTGPRAAAPRTRGAARRAGASAGAAHAPAPRAPGPAAGALARRRERRAVPARDTLLRPQARRLRVLQQLLREPVRLRTPGVLPASFSMAASNFS